MLPWLLLLIPIGVLYWVYQRYRMLSVLKRNGIKGPSPHFIFGNFHQLRGRNVLQINEWIDTYGSIFGYYDGPTPTIVVTDLELLKRIQVKDFKLFAARKGLIKGGAIADKAMNQAVGSYGLPVHRWKEQRSMLTTTFTSQKMKQSVPLINDAIDSFVETLEEKLNSSTSEVPNGKVPTSENGIHITSTPGVSKEVDLYEMWQGLTMDTIGRSAFGVLTNVQRNPSDPFLAKLKYLFEDNFSRWVNILAVANIFFPEFISVIYPLRYLQMKIALALFGGTNAHALIQHARDVIQARRKNLESESNPWSRQDLLQLMMDANLSKDQMNKMGLDQLTASAHDQNSSVEKSEKLSNGNVSKVSGHKFTDNEIVSNSLFFFAAGYETTSTLLGFMTHLLLNHQDVQDRLRQEVTELYQRDGKLDYNCVNNLPYLDAVINESLRVHSPITTFVTRVASVDYKYSYYENSDGKSGEVTITIPKGANILVPVDKLHRDPNVWPDPDKFDPERFLSGSKKSFDSISFQPFGAGPRNCIGMRFALLEAKLAVARLLLSYKLDIGPHTEVGEITKDIKIISQTPKYGVHALISRIN